MKSTGVARNIGPDRIGTARLMGYILLAIVLMALDHRGHFIPRIRATLEYAAEPLYHVVDWPVRAMRGALSYARSYRSLVAENERRKAELLVREGQLQRLGALEDENRRLRALLDATAGRDYEFRFAEMVMVSLDPYAHQVLIDRGRVDGVYEGQAVIDGEGVIGQVDSVHPHQARVRLISDPDHALPVQILRTGQRTVAWGTGDALRLSLPSLPIQADVRPGDTLVTSGLGKRFPPGFPVAVIETVDRDTGGAFARIGARPLAALDRGREVLLVHPVAAAEEPAAASESVPTQPGAAEVTTDRSVGDARP